jgi:VanZ family protein
MIIQDKRIVNGARWLFWGWLIIVLAMNVIPLGNDLNRIIHKPIFEFRLDYLTHFVSFLIFIPLYLIGERQGNPIFNDKPVLKYILIVGGSAIISECLQYLLPYRTFNPMDLISNLTGAIIGTIIISFFIPSFLKE